MVLIHYLYIFLVPCPPPPYYLVWCSMLSIRTREAPCSLSSVNHLMFKLFIFDVFFARAVECMLLPLVKLIPCVYDN